MLYVNFTHQNGEFLSEFRLIRQSREFVVLESLQFLSSKLECKTKSSNTNKIFKLKLTIIYLNYIIHFSGNEPSDHNRGHNCLYADILHFDDMVLHVPLYCVPYLSQWHMKSC